MRKTMRIKQLYVSPGMSAIWGARLRKKYGLKEYKDKNEPAVFYGFFSAAPKVVVSHKSIGVILWAGTDAQRLYRYKVLGHEIPNQKAYKKVLGMQQIYHICRSKCIQEDFEHCQLPYKFVRVSPSYSWLFFPKPLGPCIYCYGYKAKGEKYGGQEIQKLQRIFPDIKFLSKDLTNETVPHEEMHSIYEQCFLNLRLTAHDGLPNSVLEMSLMGRRSVYNGDIPGAISYDSFDDIVNIIKEEKKKIGNLGDQEISNRVRSMLDISDDWLDTDFYTIKDISYENSHPE